MFTRAIRRHQAVDPLPQQLVLAVAEQLFRGAVGELDFTPPIGQDNAFESGFRERQESLGLLVDGGHDRPRHPKKQLAGGEDDQHRGSQRQHGGAQERRPDFGQVDFRHQAEFQDRYWFIGRQDFGAAVIEADHDTRATFECALHGLGPFTVIRDRRQAGRIVVFASNQEHDLIADTLCQRKFTAVAETLELGVGYCHLVQRRIEIDGAGLAAIELGNGLDQARLAARQFRQAQPMLVDRGAVKTENRQRGNDQGGGRHDQVELAKRM